MSTISQAPTAAQTTATPSWTALLRAKFIVWKAACNARQIERAAMQQLARMSDHDLKDMGLTRSEITHAVMHGAARDRAFRRTR